MSIDERMVDVAKAVMQLKQRENALIDDLANTRHNLAANEGALQVLQEIKAEENEQPEEQPKADPDAPIFDEPKLDPALTSSNGSET